MSVTFQKRPGLACRTLLNVHLLAISPNGQLEHRRDSPSARTAERVEDRMAGVFAGYQAGDARAFSEFHSALRPLLAARLLSLGADEEVLDALLDRVFLQIHAARHTWRAGWAVEPWAAAIAQRVFRTRCITRKSARGVRLKPDPTKRYAGST